ncbi:formate dehydrogenase [Burkholderia thailandensis]|nr:formate dehydrogenase [Burkholderia thailandensis]
MFRKLSSLLAGNCGFFEVRTFRQSFLCFLCAHRRAGERGGGRFTRASFAFLI